MIQLRSQVLFLSTMKRNRRFIKFLCDAQAVHEECALVFVGKSLKAIYCFYIDFTFRRKIASAETQYVSI